MRNHGLTRLNNWTTGEIFFTPLAIQVPAAGANAQFYGPWLVYVSIPLGAIMFLMMRKRLVVPVEQTQLGALGTPPPPPVIAGDKSPLLSQSGSE